MSSTSTSERGRSSLLPADRRSEIISFVAPGASCVTVGGLLAAVSTVAPSEHGVWAAAYLVLVCGMAQVCLGLGQWYCTSHTCTPLVVAQVAGWNLGNAAVLVGVLTDVRAVADTGAALLVVTLILLAGALSTGRRAEGTRRWLRYCYGLLIAALLVSIPIGLILMRLRG